MSAIPWPQRYRGRGNKTGKGVQMPQEPQQARCGRRLSCP